MNRKEFLFATRMENHSAKLNFRNSESCLNLDIQNTSINQFTYVKSNGNYYFKTYDTYQIIKPCSVGPLGCLLTPSTPLFCPIITTCNHQSGRNSTCNLLINASEFKSDLTGKTRYTKSFDPLDCSTENVIYGTECTLEFWGLCMLMTPNKCYATKWSIFLLF